MTRHNCNVPRDDVQSAYLAKFNINVYVLTHRSVSFEPVVGFTNNSTQVLGMMSRCAVLMFDQGRFKYMPLFLFKVKLMKGKALRKHSLYEKTAASVLLKPFISSNE